MNTGETNRVTSLTFTHYDPAEYLLPLSSNLSLNSINKTILGLFGNDIYIYTMLVGKAKGLWWKYWFMDETIKGYEEGDMVFANGIEEIRFLKQYWGGVKEMADYSTTVDLLPQFVVTEESTVKRYLTALNEYFSLGNRSYERQMYISLRDDNKDKITLEDSWKPYLVTSDELHKRENLLVELLESALLSHNEQYHKVLDKLDYDDRAYEKYDEPLSIYDDVLTKYLPKKKVSSKESQTWVDFVNGTYGNSMLGFGNVDYDFLHIYKPLGSSLYHLETWVRCDGHVTVRGYVPVGLMTELTPQPGTVEFNRWKMGGQRRFAFRFDYPINDKFSKVYFREKPEELTGDISLRGGMKAREPDDPSKVKMVIYKKDDSKDAQYQKEWDAVQSDIDLMEQQMEQLQTDISTYKMESTVEKPAFPQPDSDHWAKGESMIYPSGALSPAEVESNYVKTMTRPFLINPKTIGLKGERTWLIDPKYKKSSSIPGLINPKELLSHINNGKPDNSPEWKYWRIDMDTTINSPEVLDENKGTHKNVYSRHVSISLKNPTDISQFADLIHYSNPNVKAMNSSKDGKLGDYLKEAVDEKFRMVRFESEQVEEDLTQDFIDKETGKKTKGLLHISYTVITQLECAIDLIEDKSDHKRFDDVVDEIGDLADHIIRDDEIEKATRIYTLVNYHEGYSGSILYYPDNNGNAPFEKIMEVSPSKELIKKNGHWDVFKDLLDANKYDHHSQVTSMGNGSLESHTFSKKMDVSPAQDEEVSPVDTTSENDPSYIASNLRLIREFGTANSPPILNITSSIILPDADQLIAPSLNCCPGITLTDWTWENGQSIIFNVPSATQNISFEVTGMLNKDNTDFSFYYIPMEWTTPDSNVVNELKWVSMAFEYKKALTKLQLAEKDGLSNEGAILHMNSQYMLKGIADSIIDNLSFVSLMRARIIDWTSCRTKMWPVNVESNCLSGYDALDELYDILWEHIDTYMRLGYLYYIYENMLNGMMDASKERLLMMAYLRAYILRTDEIDSSAIQQKIAQANSSISERMNSGNVDLANAMSEIVAEISKYHEKHLRQSEAVHGGIPYVPLRETDEGYEEWDTARAAWHDSFDSNVKEIDEYVIETNNTINSILQTKKTLDNYLKMDLEASLDKYVRDSLVKLRFSGARYFRNATGICQGYISYLNKWCDIMLEATPNTKKNLAEVITRLGEANKELNK